MERRFFLKVAGAAGLSACAPALAREEAPGEAGDSWAVLVDTTRCAGCRTCESACAEANGLPPPEAPYDDVVFAERRKTGENQYSIMNRFETDAGEVYVKRQCMHCLQPACASACLTKAMLKTVEGPVVWRAGKCMGCRFCMVSCPFDAPKFEYHSAVPRIRKCVLCHERLKEGERPACVENCPAEALVFGARSEVLREARRRIAESPDLYVDHVYGEHEVGGTSWLYLASAPFEQLGFSTDLGEVAYPEHTKGFLYSVPVVLTLWPAFLLALNRASAREGDDSAGKEA